MSYKSYIESSEWRGKHRDFLRKAGYRCAFSGVSLERHYNCHHTHYGTVGKEVYWRDVVAVHPFVHRWILHGILSGFKRPSQQRNYPNGLQQLAHAWCRAPTLLKLVFCLACLIVLVVFGGAGWRNQKTLNSAILLQHSVQVESHGISPHRK